MEPNLTFKGHPLARRSRYHAAPSGWLARAWDLCTALSVGWSVAAWMDREHYLSV